MAPGDELKKMAREKAAHEAQGITPPEMQEIIRRDFESALLSFGKEVLEAAGVSAREVNLSMSCTDTECDEAQRIVEDIENLKRELSCGEEGN